MTKSDYRVARITAKRLLWLKKRADKNCRSLTGELEMIFRKIDEEDKS